MSCQGPHSQKDLEPKLKPGLWGSCPMFHTAPEGFWEVVIQSSHLLHAALAGLPRTWILATCAVLPVLPTP